MGRSRSWLGTDTSIKHGGVKLFVWVHTNHSLVLINGLINGGYGNEHNKVGIFMSRLIFPRISEHAPFPKQEKGKMTFLNNTAGFFYRDVRFVIIHIKCVIIGVLMSSVR